MLYDQHSGLDQDSHRDCQEPGAGLRRVEMTIEFGKGNEPGRTLMLSPAPTGNIVDQTWHPCYLGLNVTTGSCATCSPMPIWHNSFDLSYRLKAI